MPTVWPRPASIAAVAAALAAGTMLTSCGAGSATGVPTSATAAVPATTVVGTTTASGVPGPTAPGSDRPADPTTVTPPATAAPASPLLPKLQLHPGAVNAALGMAQLCAAGFSTSSIRPPVSYTTRIKQLELGNGGSITGPSGTTYTVVGEHLAGTVSDYELDHLISLEIGGNPEDPRNLWMEPWERQGSRFAPGGLGAESKDVVENRLHREMCAGTISLADAQAEIAANWETVQ